MSNGNGSVVIKDGGKNPFNLKTTLSGNAVIPYNIIEEISGANIARVIEKLSDISSSVAAQNLNFTSNTTALASLVKKYPTDITKKKYINAGSSGVPNSPFINIEWDTTSSGSFRIAEYDQDRKYLTVQNDSNLDLYISVDNDENSKIIVDFDDLMKAKELSVKYQIYSGTTDPANLKDLFNFSWDQYTNIYTYFTQSHINPLDNKKYGYNINFLTIQNASDKTGRLIINLTPDYVCDILNKNNADPGGGTLILSMSGGAKAEYPIVKSFADNKKYFTVSAEYSGSSFRTPLEPVEYYANLDTINGFYIYDTGSAPENYTYILNPSDSMTIYDTEAVLSYFGYFINSGSATNIDVRVTEAR